MYSKFVAETRSVDFLSIAIKISINRKYMRLKAFENLYSHAFNISNLI